MKKETERIAKEFGFELPVPIEREPQPGKNITLRDIVDYHFPIDQYRSQQQMFDNISVLSRHCLEGSPFSPYVIASDSMLPLIASEPIKKTPKLLHPHAIDPKNFDLESAKNRTFWNLLDNEGIKLDLMFESGSDVAASSRSKAKNYFEGSGWGNTMYEKIVPESVGLPTNQREMYEGTKVYRLKGKQNRMRIPTIGNDTAMYTKRSPLFVIQDQETTLGERYTSLKLCVDTKTDAPDVQAVSGVRTLFEMRLIQPKKMSALDSGDRVNWDKTIPWRHDWREPHGVFLTPEMLDTFTKPLEVDFKGLDLEDPRSFYDICLLAGRLLALQSLKGKAEPVGTISHDTIQMFRNAFTRLAVTVDQNSHLNPFEQVISALARSGEDYRDDVSNLVSSLMRSYLSNNHAFLENARALGLDLVIPGIKTISTSRNLSLMDLYTALNPLTSADLGLSDLPPKKELQMYANHMGFALTIAKESVSEAGGTPQGCVIVNTKTGDWVIAYDHTIIDKNLYSRSILKALERAAKNWGPDLDDCAVITPYKPDVIDATEIRKHKGVKTVVYGIELVTPGSELNPLEDQDLDKKNKIFGKPPKIIRGLMQREVLAFYLNTVYKDQLRKNGFDYYGGTTSQLYADQTRIINQESSKEHEIMEQIFGSDFTGWNVLDAGCGPGDDVAWLAAKGATVHGIDTSVDFIASAKANYPHIESQFQEANILRLPYQDASFDMIMSKYALNELEPNQIESALAEIYRCLRPGGSVFLLLHDPTSQLLSKDAISGQIILDQLKSRKVMVTIYEGVVKLESVLTHADVLKPFTKYFIMEDFDELQDKVKLHDDKDIKEMMIVLGRKPETFL